MSGKRRSRPAGTKRAAPSTSPTSNARWILGGAALVVVVAAVAAVLLTRPSDTASGSASTFRPASSAAATTRFGSGASLPAFTATTGDPAVGRPIPEVHGASFDGSAVSIHADGRPKLLLFLAHWCPHCQREVPVVQSWLDAGRLPGAVDLISVATASDPARPNYPPADWLRREHWQPPVLADGDNSAADRFGLSAFPYWVAVRSDGTVASRLTGELTPAQLDALAASVAK